MPGQVPADIQDARLAMLQAVLTQQMNAFNAACVGRTMDVLLATPGRFPGQLVGRTPYLQAVIIDGMDAARIGTTCAVTITKTGTNTLHGVVADARTEALAS